MSKMMSKRALKWLQYELESLSCKVSQRNDYYFDNKDRLLHEQIQVLEYFIEQVKQESKYLEENKECSPPIRLPLNSTVTTAILTAPVSSAESRCHLGGALSRALEPLTWGSAAIKWQPDRRGMFYRGPYRHRTTVS